MEWRTKATSSSQSIQKSIWQKSIPFHDRNTQKLGIEGNFLNLIKDICEERTAKGTILSVKEWVLST